MKDPLTIVVERDPETGWLIGEVVELPGCYSQAPDLPSLERNMREAINVYMKTTPMDLPVPEFVGTWKIEVEA
jgi:predicted RNase H-like HicB family nuclease